ncbi:hypothetical protein HNQ78_001388 [Phycisphaera mikurensis]|nr:hypothetical protein [Phycisphaera mikurensis]
MAGPSPRREADPGRGRPDTWAGGSDPIGRAARRVKQPKRKSGHPLRRPTRNRPGSPRAGLRQRPPSSPRRQTLSRRRQTLALRRQTLSRRRETLSLRRQTLARIRRPSSPRRSLSARGRPTSSRRESPPCPRPPLRRAAANARPTRSSRGAVSEPLRIPVREAAAGSRPPAAGSRPRRQSDGGEAVDTQFSRRSVQAPADPADPRRIPMSRGAVSRPRRIRPALRCDAAGATPGLISVVCARARGPRTASRPPRSADATLSAR